jgi:DNA topoisomerase-3
LLICSEGENIGAEVAQVCRSVNSRIIVKRARFSVIQRREILHSWNSLVELDMAAAEAVDARSELDLRIGAVFTRFQTINLKNRFFDIQEKKVLSYGPCQFPTLGFVVDRYIKAKNFKEEPFWKLEATFEKDGISSKFYWNRSHLFDHQSTLALYENCLRNSTGLITKLHSKPTSKWYN